MKGLAGGGVKHVVKRDLLRSRGSFLRIEGPESRSPREPNEGSSHLTGVTGYGLGKLAGWGDLH